MSKAPKDRLRAIDLETSGQDAGTAGVVEIAFCDVVRKAGLWSVAGGWPSLVNPGHPIPPQASAVHQIIDSDVANARPWPEAAAEMLEDERVGAFAAHYAQFERQWLEPYLAGRQIICTYRCALRLWPEAPAHNLQTLRHWRQPVGLNRALADSAHRAYPDAYVCAHLLRDMLNLMVDGEPVTVAQLVEWSSQPALLRTCQLGEWRGKPWSEVDDGFLRWVLSPGKSFDEDVTFTVRTELERRAAERQAAIAAANRVE